MSHSKIYDVIVIGVGSMGSATLNNLAKQGAQVLGIDQYESPHTFGSHTGQSRIIRMAYFEHPDYVPLLQRSYKLWEELEQDTGEQHFYKTGLIYYGNPSDMLISGVLKSVKKYDLDIVQNKPIESALTIPAHIPNIYEPNAGYIIPEKTISSYIELSKINGANIIHNAKVIRWNQDGSTISVTTNNGTYKAHKIVITAGAWSTDLIHKVNSQLTVTKQSLFWVKPKNIDDYHDHLFPCWNIQDPNYDGLFYGFPLLEYQGQSLIKFAHHYKNISFDIERGNRDTPQKDKEIAQYVIDTYFPNKIESIVDAKTCLYTNSSDENFIIDYAEGSNKQVVFACGFSGHGFKFVPAVGKILSEMVLEEKTESPIGFLSAHRF